MRIRNKLKELLLELGIKSMIPSKQLLSEKLGGMTPHRFNQILNNDSKTELSVLELDLLTRWIAGITGQVEDAIRLLEREPAHDEAQS